MTHSMRFAFLLFAFQLTTSFATAGKPNMLFIVGDDLNTHVATSGYPQIKTPAFDELAAAGMTFRRACCQYPVCGPSRASFLHGMHPQTTGVLDGIGSFATTPGTASDGLVELIDLFPTLAIAVRQPELKNIDSKN